MRALVTGAGARLGAAMARALGEAGHDVALHHRSDKAGAEAGAAAIRALGREAAALGADLLDPDACGTLVGRAAAALGGPIDLLVNNASVFDRDELETATLEGWDRNLGVNLRAPFLLTQAFAAQAPEAGSDGEPLATGVVVNVIDQRVLKLTPHFMTYTLAKSALWTLTQTAAQALAPRIRVNAIGPGPTLRASRQSEAHFAAQRAGTPLGRGADAGDICDALLYLVGAKAVTGQLLCVDGGQHLGWRTPDVIGPR